MKLNTISLLFLCWLIPLPAIAQHYFYNNQYYESDCLFEGGISLGAMNCLTDIGGRSGNGSNFLKDLNIQTTRLSGGAFLTFSYRNVVGARLELNKGSIAAYDSILKGDPSVAHNRYLRNLHFKSSITEVLLLIEWHPLVWLTGSSGAGLLSPYVTGGAGVFWFNPIASLNGNWVSLSQLHTEGQGFAEFPERKEYALTQLNFPFGAGIKYECSALWNLRLEALHRFIQTDYLDDVSTRYIDPALFHKYLPALEASYAVQLHNRQNEIDPSAKTTVNEIRGNHSKNDAYFTLQCKLSVVIGRERR